MTTMNLSSTLKSLIKPLSIKCLSPDRLGMVVTKLPQRINILAVETIANNAFSEQVEDGDFTYLENKTLQIHLLDANLFSVFTYRKNRIRCLEISNSKTDCEATLSISSANAIQLLQQKTDPDTLFFQRKLRISGDTELAHHTKNIIDTLDPESFPRSINQLTTLYYNNILT